MFRIESRIIIVLLFFSVFHINGQPPHTVDEVIALALQQSPLLKAHTDQIRHDKMMEKSAWNLSDPELLMESPTGDFMTLGVQQSFEFPTVYVRQRQLAREKTLLATKSADVATAEITQKVKTAYLGLQYALAVMLEQKKQDSIYLAIARTAERQYAAGQIDFVEKSYAGMKYAEIHSRYISAGADVLAMQQQLAVYTGINSLITPTPLIPVTGELIFSGQTTENAVFQMAPVMQYYMQSERVAEKAIQLEKSKVWPDFTIGYLNPAESGTPIPMHMRVGLSIPIWFWQYKTTIKAAKTRLDIAGHYSKAGKQNLEMEWNHTKNAAIKFKSILDYYEAESLTGADEIIQSSSRMFDAGQYDYIKYLTTLADAYRVRIEYLNNIKEYNQTLIDLEYIIGR